MKKQYKIAIISVIVLALVGVYFGKNYMDKKSKGSNILEWTSFDVQKEKGKPTLLELGTTTCGVCKQMNPILVSLDKKYGEKVNIKKINLERQDNYNIAVKYNAMAVPVMVFIDEKGNDFYKQVGYMSEEEIVKILDSMGVK